MQNKRNDNSSQEENHSGRQPSPEQQAHNPFREKEIPDSKETPEEEANEEQERKEAMTERD